METPIAHTKCITHSFNCEVISLTACTDRMWTHELIYTVFILSVYQCEQVFDPRFVKFVSLQVDGVEFSADSCYERIFLLSLVPCASQHWRRLSEERHNQWCGDVSSSPSWGTWEYQNQTKGPSMSCNRAELGGNREQVSQGWSGFCSVHLVDFCWRVVTSTVCVHDSGKLMRN